MTALNDFKRDCFVVAILATPRNDDKFRSKKENLGKNKFQT